MVHYLINLYIVIGLAGNNQRGTRFVDQNGIYFVDYGKVQLALYFIVLIGHHIVAQVVEAEFIVGTVGDVGAISVLAVELFHIADNYAHRQTEEIIQRLHGGGITGGQIVVHGNHVYTFAGQSVQVNRQCSHQSFTFTSAHLGDFAVMQHHTADQLHVEMAHTQNATRSFAANGKRFY